MKHFCDFVYVKDGSHIEVFIIKSQQLLYSKNAA